MKAGSAFLIFFPILLEGCCVENHHKKKTDFQQNTTQYYAAVEGEIMMMPCVQSLNPPVETLWLRTDEGEGTKDTHLNCMTAFVAEAKHWGKYESTESKHVLHLQVLEKHSPGCFEPEQSSVYLTESSCGKIPCPGFLCGGNSKDVVWYQNNIAVSELQRRSCEKDELLHLQVYQLDTGLFFCDRLITVEGTSKTLRRAVNVTAIPSETASKPPRIPSGNKTEEAELGQPHNLTCQVYFGFELNFSPKVQWYMNYNGDADNAVLLHTDTPEQKRVTFAEYEVTQTAIIKEVTPPHLSHTYTCVASNTVGSSSVTIKLKRRIKVKWPSLVGYPIVSLLLVVGLGVILHAKWLEIRLIYKCYFKFGKHGGDEKDFDVLVSYVWSRPTADLTEVSTFSSRSGLSKEEEAFFSSMALLSKDKSEASQVPLQVLVPHVLEDRWGYRLCLLERDVVPGGAYTNDVVLAIKRSRMLICILSAEYLNNTNAVFVLESGIQAVLQSSAFKLLLIWANRASTSLVQPDPPLPNLVQRALPVLPGLDWTSDNPARGNSNFWRSLRKTLPETESDAAHSRFTP